MRRLGDWRSSPRRKPLILDGPRQVGKTWLLKEFGRRHYDNMIYLDFEETPSLGAIFDSDYDIPRIVSQLGMAGGSPITPGRTLIVLDEVQACPRALLSLKYFNDQANQYHVAAAGSLLGIALHEDSSFPVGKVNFLHLDPLSFPEFLAATGQEALAAAFGAPDWPLLAPFHDRLIGMLRDYLFTGGMPEAVASFADERDYRTVREIQLEILRAYDRDFSKHAPAQEVPRIRGVWQSIPGQLAREQRRFSYTPVAPGARARTHWNAIQWLIQAGVVLEVPRVSAPRLPLTGCADPAAFRLYLADVGLLGALSGLSPAAVLEPDRLFTEFRGSLTEQYVAMQLWSAFGRSPAYWANDGGTAEVDFLVQRDHDVVPVEVKAGLNLKAKSLGVYRGKYAPELAVRTSLAPFARHGDLLDLPLYAIGALPGLQP